MKGHLHPLEEAGLSPIFEQATPSLFAVDIYRRSQRDLPPFSKGAYTNAHLLSGE